MTLMLGKLPARTDSVKFRLTSYVDVAAVLPTILPGQKVGHIDKLLQPRMYLNDQLGDCVLAGAAEETVLFNALGQKQVQINDSNVQAAYSAVTGYVPGDPTTDQGTDMQAAASWRRKTGITDAQGNNHKIGAYLALEPGNVDQLRVAIYLFGAVGIGVNFPSFWMDQFNKGGLWSAKRGAAIEGGHYIPGFASLSKSGHIQIVSWAKKVGMTVAGYKQFSDEAIAYVSPEALYNGKTIEGYDYATLQTDLAAL